MSAYLEDLRADWLDDARAELEQEPDTDEPQVEAEGSSR